MCAKADGCTGTPCVAGGPVRAAWHTRGRGGGAPRPPPGDDEPVTYYRDEAVVLRVQKLGEADRIVTMLTRTQGRVRAVGKGVRRTKSRFGARLEPPSHIDVQLYRRTVGAESGHDQQRLQL